MPAERRRPSPPLMHRARAQRQTRAPSLLPLTHQGRSWDLTPTISVDVTATCVLLVARALRSMLRTRAQDLFPRGHSPQTSLQWALTQQVRSSDSTLTRAQYSTASCALLTASSPNSIPLARYSPTPTPSTLWAR